jgi:hypothetical protein
VNTGSVTLRTDSGEPWSLDFEIDGNRALPIRYVWCGFRVVDAPPEHVVDRLYQLAEEYVRDQVCCE